MFEPVNVWRKKNIRTADVMFSVQLKPDTTAGSMRLCVIMINTLSKWHMSDIFFSKSSGLTGDFVEP